MKSPERKFEIILLKKSETVLPLPTGKQFSFTRCDESECVKTAVDERNVEILLVDSRCVDTALLETIAYCKKVTAGNFQAILALTTPTAQRAYQDLFQFDEFLPYGFSSEELVARLFMTEKRIHVNQNYIMLCAQDALTGLLNHRFVMESLAQEMERSHRYHSDLSVIMLDIDFFKSVNTRYGHNVGDAVLAKVGHFLRSNVKTSDIVGRYGGEEFLIILPNTNASQCEKTGQRLRKKLIETQLLQDPPLEITISIGFANLYTSSSGNAKEFVDFADKAMLMSKSQGRNRVVGYSQMAEALRREIPQREVEEHQVIEYKDRLFKISETSLRMYREEIRTLMQSLDAHDPNTRDHSINVAHYAQKIAQRMNVGLAKVEAITQAALMHDVGKVGIPRRILLKPDRLTDEEYSLVKKHALIGFQICRNIRFLREESKMILHHHEYFDGGGYPFGLVGKKIPLGARIISVCDAFDTMIHSRAYRDSVSSYDALAEIERCKKGQFCPEVADVFLEVMGEK